MLRILTVLTTGLMVLAVATAAAAQTTSSTQPSTATQSPAISEPNKGAFDKLSPGNQKITRALYEAQQTPTQTSGSTSGTTSGSSSRTSKTYSLDDIAAMKQSKGWGQVFKEMKAKGYFPDAKNLGQVVSGKYHPQSGTTGGTAITSASGKSQVVGNSTKAGKSGTGHFEDDASAGARGSSNRDNSRGYRYGHGDRSGSSASTGSSGSSGHGRGPGK